MANYKIAKPQPLKNCNFYPHLSLETVFPSLNLTQNCSIINIGFLTQQHVPCQKDNPPNLTKHESRGITTTSPNFPTVH